MCLFGRKQALEASVSPLDNAPSVHANEVRSKLIETAFNACLDRNHLSIFGRDIDSTFENNPPTPQITT